MTLAQVRSETENRVGWVGKWRGGGGGARESMLKKSWADLGWVLKKGGPPRGNWSFVSRK